MLPKSFALSDDEESLRSIPGDDCDVGIVGDEPISLNEYSSTGIELPQLSWHGYCNCPSSLNVTNTGETVSITGKWKKGRPYVAGGPLNGSYLFSQIHFHWPSEHLLNEKRYELEMHAVHYKAAYLTEERAMKENDGTVVLVYLFEIGTEKTSMSKLTCLLSRVKNKGNKAELSDCKLNDFMKPFVSNYFIYWGSADIAGSSYSLQWLISCSRLCISQNELCDLKEIFRNGGGEPPRKQMPDSKPTSAGLFLVGGTINVAFSEGNRSEVRFSDVDEASEVPDKSKSCCFLAKYKKRNSIDKTRDSSSPDGSLEKLYLRRSPSQSSRESTSYPRNGNRTFKNDIRICRSRQQPCSIDTQTSSGSISTCNCKARKSQSKHSETYVNVSASKSSDTNANNTDRCSSATSNKDEDGRGGKQKKRTLKCIVRKNKTHDCIGNGCENQVRSAECDRNPCDVKQTDQGEKEKGSQERGNQDKVSEEMRLKRKRRDSSKFESSSEDDAGTSEKPKKTLPGKSIDNGKEVQVEENAIAEAVTEPKEKTQKHSWKKGSPFGKHKGKKEAQAQVNTETEEVSKEMGQHQPIILAPATVNDSLYIMKSVGTMTTQPPRPCYIQGTDLVGEGSDFSSREPCISSSQIWNRLEEEQQKEVPEKADKIVSAPDHEDPEDLELLPIPMRITPEVAPGPIQTEMEMTAPSPARLISDDEQSVSALLAILAKDSSLRNVAANLSEEEMSAEEGNATQRQSLATLLTKAKEAQELVELLEEASGNEKPVESDKALSPDNVKETENSAKPSTEPSLSSNLDKALREMSVQTESIPAVKSSTTDSDKSNKESVSVISTEEPSPPNPSESPTNQLTIGNTEKSKQSFIINVLSEITKDPTLVAELVKTSKETPLAGVIAQALRDLTELEQPKKESSEVKIQSKSSKESSKSANATTQTLSRIVSSKPSRPFSSSRNIPTKASKESTDSGISAKYSRNRALKEPSESTVASSKPTSAKSSKIATGSAVSAPSQTGTSESKPKQLSGSKESGNIQTRSSKVLGVADSPQNANSSSVSILDKTSKESEALPLEKSVFSLVSALSNISKDPSFAKELASIFRNKSMTADTDPSICGSDIISKSDAGKDPSPTISKQVSSASEWSRKIAEKSSSTSKKSIKKNDSPPIRKFPEEEPILEVLKNNAVDQTSADDSPKAAPVNVLCPTLKEQSSPASVQNSLKKQSSVNADIMTRKLSSTKTSRPSLTGRKESTGSKKDGVSNPRTPPNRSSQSLTSDQRPIVEFSPSKEKLLIEILERVCLELPGTAELLKSVTWVDILITALKDSSNADRSPNSQSLVTILDRISRDSTSSTNTVGREDQPEKGKVGKDSKLGASNKPMSLNADTISEDDNISNDQVEINVSERACTVPANPGNCDTLIDVIVSSSKHPVPDELKKAEKKSTVSLPKKAGKSASVSSEVNNGTKEVDPNFGNKKKIAKSKTPAAKSSSASNPSKPSSTADVEKNSKDDTQNYSETPSTVDVLTEAPKNNPSASENTMLAKEQPVVKQQKNISRESSLTENTNEELVTFKTDGIIADDGKKETDDEKTTPEVSRNPSAINLECKKFRSQGSDTKDILPVLAESLKNTSIFMAIGNKPTEPIANADIKPENSKPGQIADESPEDNEKPLARDAEIQSAITLTNVSEKPPVKDSSKGSAKEDSISDNDQGQPRRDHERNRVNFETVSRRNSIGTERPEAEKIHRQEDLNESIKSKRSTDTKRSGEDDTSVEMWKRLPERVDSGVCTVVPCLTLGESASDEISKRFTSGTQTPLTSDSENKLGEKTEMYLKTCCIVKNDATESGIESLESKASDSTGRSERSGIAEKKPMYFISEAIEVDPKTGKKVLTGRFVTDKKFTGRLRGDRECTPCSWSNAFSGRLEADCVPHILLLIFEIVIHEGDVNCNDD